jgi:hypothetical protein
MSHFLVTPVLFNLPCPKSWETWWAGYGFGLGFVPQPSESGTACQLTFLRHKVIVHPGSQPVPDSLKPKMAQLLKLLNKTADCNPTNFGRLLRTKQARQLRAYLVLRTDLQEVVESDGVGHTWQEAVDDAWTKMCESVKLNRITTRAVRALWSLA